MSRRKGCGVMQFDAAGVSFSMWGEIWGVAGRDRDAFEVGRGYLALGPLFMEQWTAVLVKQ